MISKIIDVLKKAVLWGLIPFFLLIFTLNLIFIYKYKPNLERKIKEFVLNETGGIYSIQFNSDKTQILWGKIVLEKVSISIKDSIYQKLKSSGLAPCQQYTIQINQLVVYVRNIFLLIFKEEASIGLIKLERPLVDIKKLTGHCRNDLPKNSKKNTSPQLSLKSLSIQKLYVESGKIKLETQSQEKWTPNFLGENLSFKSENIHWNRLDSSHLSLLKIFNTIPFILVMHPIRWWSPQRNFSILAKRLFYSNEDGTLELQSFLGGDLDSSGKIYDPQIPHTPGIHFSGKIITLNQINLPLLLLGKSFLVKKISLRGGLIQITDDPNLPHPVSTHPLPQTLLRKIKIPFAIQNLNFKDLRLQYFERKKDQVPYGFLEFYPIDGILSNLHNQTKDDLNEDWVHLQVKSSLFGSGKVLAEMGFNLQSQNEGFHFRGEVQNFSISRINPMCVPLAGIKVQSGTLSNLIFEMDADSSTSQGTVHALYKNLRLKFLSEPYLTSPKKLRTISSLTNTFLILNNNPLVGEKERIYRFSLERNPSRTIFNFIWQSLFESIKPIIGIIPGREQNINHFINELKSYHSWEITNKEERRFKKSQRKKKRVLKILNRNIKESILLGY